MSNKGYDVFTVYYGDDGKQKFWMGEKGELKLVKHQKAKDTWLAWYRGSYVVDEELNEEYRR